MTRCCGDIHCETTVLEVIIRSSSSVRRSKHAVHGVGEALCTLVAVRIVGRVHAAEVKSIQTGAVFYARYVRCHKVHLQATLLRVVS